MAAVQSRVGGHAQGQRLGDRAHGGHQIAPYNSEEMRPQPTAHPASSRAGAELFSGTKIRGFLVQSTVLGCKKEVSLQRVVLREQE